MARQPSRLETSLARWREAGVIDAATAERIVAFESGRADTPDRSAVLLWALGGVLLAAGVVLFVAAHWAELSPGQRFALAIATVGACHGAGAWLGRTHPSLGVVLHAVGTAACGAGIFLSGQVFHLAESWPQGFLLWTLAAAAAWALLGQWPQAAATAILGPVWLLGEWAWATRHLRHHHDVEPAFLVLTCLAYLAIRPHETSPSLKAARILGAVVLLPSVAWLAVTPWRNDEALPTPLRLLGWGVAVGAPLVLAALADRRLPWELTTAAGWVALLVFASSTPKPDAGRELVVYAVCLVGAVALTAWGYRDRQMIRVNLGILGFGVTVLVYYFDSFIDKVGRAMSLLGLGLLFLLLGWLLSTTRRKIASRLEEVSS